MSARERRLLRANSTIKGGSKLNSLWKRYSRAGLVLSQTVGDVVFIYHGTKDNYDNVEVTQGNASWRDYFMSFGHQEYVVVCPPQPLYKPVPGTTRKSLIQRIIHWLLY